MIVGVVGGILGILLIGSLLLYVWKGKHRGYKHEVFVDVAGILPFSLFFQA